MHAGFPFEHNDSGQKDMSQVYLMVSEAWKAMWKYAQKCLQCHQSTKFALYFRLETIS